MADLHVISALREKRALVAGLIEKLERKLEQHRADLTHIDGVLRLFQSDRNPDEIKPKRTYAKRTRYFARNELARLCMGALREAIAARVIAAKGFETADNTLRAAIRDQLLTVLRAARKRETVEQMGLGRGVRWKLTDAKNGKVELEVFRRKEISEI